MEAIDANEYLIQFLGSIDNLPSEIHYHFSELTNKDQEIEQLMERIERRKRRLWNLYDGLPIDEDSDCSVVESIYEDDEEDEESNSDDYDRYDEDQDGEQTIKKKRRRVTRVVTEFEDEEMLKDKIIKDYVRASQLQDEKIELSDRALALVERHIKRLDEDFDSLFPQHNLRDSSTSTPASPSRVESSTFSSVQTIAQSSASASAHARNVTSYTSVPATSSNFPTTTYEYNKGLYSSADSDEGQISLPMLPNPSSSLTRSNKALAGGANNGRRRKQNNIQSSTTSYTSNTETATAVNNSHLSRGIKIRVPNEEHLSISSSIADSNGINNANLLDQDDSTAAYDNSLVPEGNSFLSNYIPDPNEPVYCICRQVSFGEMIGCDGENCPVEWYHIDCVGLSAVPEGRWYCDHCTGMLSSQKKRKRGRPAAGSVS